MQNLNEGLLFDPALSAEIKDRFYYVDADPEFGQRLFFENSGGSLRLKASVEAQAKYQAFPDCPERLHDRSRALKKVQLHGIDDIMHIVFGASGGALISEMTASQAMFQIVGAILENCPGKSAVTSVLEHPSAYDAVKYYCDKTGKEFRVAQANPKTGGIDVEEIRRVGNIILVIDEVHNIVGAGDAEGSMNAANILKPALSRGEIQVIGATTFAEYRKHIEKDAALERRFQPVTVAEPSIDDSVEILKGVRRYYEDFHGVVIPDDMCRLAVVLSERYITDRFLPDKAIDLIDEACSDVNLKNPDLIRTDEVEKEIGDYARERELLASAPPKTGDEYDEQELDRRYERIAELRSREMQLQTELDALRAASAVKTGNARGMAANETLASGEPQGPGMEYLGGHGVNPEYVDRELNPDAPEIPAGPAPVEGIIMDFDTKEE